MFSANNFYQWTYETYLKDKNFSMLTYHPFGTRGYKNLQSWEIDNHYGVHELLKNAQVLMNDQEPIRLDYMLNWKQQLLADPGPPFDTVVDITIRDKKEDSYWKGDVDLKKWNKQKDQYTSLVDHFTTTTSDIEFVGQLMFPGIVKPIIVHSELNSQDVDAIQNHFVPVYVFWHGLVSRDWYRHWKHNTQCRPHIKRADNSKRFLLYARAWTGTRTYRLRFVEQVIKNKLHQSFKYNFLETDNGEFYRQYTDVELTDYFEPQQVSDINSSLFFEQILKGHNADNQKPFEKGQPEVTSNSSACIDVSDYESTSIQVVAETLFETDKIYLTEKTFQPIVAGQPFLTLSAPNTLQTLKHYGFKTFSNLWDESYDQEQDHDRRMEMVIEQIAKLNNLSDDKFKTLYQQCLTICEYNRQHFFSDLFEHQMLLEYDTNFKSAFAKQKEHALTNPGGSRLAIADQFCFKGYHSEFHYEQDQSYLKYVLARAREYSEEQYQAILKQYWWAKTLEDN
jgi:hypothetical protein